MSDGTRPAFTVARKPALSPSPSLAGARQPTSDPLPVVSHALIVDLARNAIMTALLVAGPLLAVALGVGLIVSVIQAVTQIQEQTLSFVPKLIGVAVVFLVLLPWMLQILVKYTTELFRSIPALAS